MARILIVDDEDSIRDLVRLVLERDGHSVEDAAGGAEALEKLKRASYDVVVLDRGMPRITGMQVLRDLRADPARRATKVVMCTAAGMMSDVEEALSAGADDYVFKPLDMKTLSEKVAKAAREAQAAAPPSGGLLGRVRDLFRGG